MRLLHLLEDDTMKINEVQMQEAEPNYEVMKIYRLHYLE
mgnify:CR=1 FL=1